MLNKYRKIKKIAKKHGYTSILKKEKNYVIFGNDHFNEVYIEYNCNRFYAEIENLSKGKITDRVLASEYEEFLYLFEGMLFNERLSESIVDRR